MIVLLSENANHIEDLLIRFANERYYILGIVPKSEYEKVNCSLSCTLARLHEFATIRFTESFEENAIKNILVQYTNEVFKPDSINLVLMIDDLLLTSQLLELNQVAPIDKVFWLDCATMSDDLKRLDAKESFNKDLEESIIKYCIVKTQEFIVGTPNGFIVKFGSMNDTIDHDAEPLHSADFGELLWRLINPTSIQLKSSVETQASKLLRVVLIAKSCKDSSITRKFNAKMPRMRSQYSSAVLATPVNRWSSSKRVPNTNDKIGPFTNETDLRAANHWQNKFPKPASNDKE